MAHFEERMGKKSRKWSESADIFLNNISVSFDLLRLENIGSKGISFFLV